MTKIHHFLEPSSNPKSYDRKNLKNFSGNSNQRNSIKKPRILQRTVYLDWRCRTWRRSHHAGFLTIIRRTISQVQIELIFTGEISLAIYSWRNADHYSTSIICSKHTLPPAAQCSIHKHFGTRLSMFTLQLEEQRERRLTTQIQFPLRLYQIKNKVFNMAHISKIS